jgi:hypothetical protein
MSSCVGAVTIASATSGTVSDTRVIGVPTFSTVDRPTSRSISEAPSGTNDPVTAGAAANPGGAWLLRLRRRHQDHDDETRP